jgi:hypothetical protein
MLFRATPSANRPYCGLKWQEHGGEVTWKLRHLRLKKRGEIKEYREFREYREFSEFREFREFSVVLKSP